MASKIRFAQQLTDRAGCLLPPKLKKFQYEEQRINQENFIQKLCENLFDDVPMHICKPHIPATESESAFCMLDPQQMKHGGMKVMNLPLILNGFISKIIGSPTLEPPLLHHLPSRR